MAVHGAGQHRSVGQWVQLARRGFPGFSSSKSVGLRVLAKHAGRERQEELKRKKQKLFFFPCCTSRGRKKRNSVVQNNTVLSFSFSFFFFYMKRCRFGQNAPFHLNMAPEYLFPNQPSIIFCSFQLQPRKLQSPPL